MSFRDIRLHLSFQRGECLPYLKFAICLSGTSDYIYLYVTEKRSWNEALQVCENYGGTLARITSQEVQESLFANFGSGGVWEGHP